MVIMKFKFDKLLWNSRFYLLEEIDEHKRKRARLFRKAKYYAERIRYFFRRDNERENVNRRFSK